jgi:hypothetical protein
LLLIGGVHVVVGVIGVVVLVRRAPSEEPEPTGP